MEGEGSSGDFGDDMIPLPPRGRGEGEDEGWKRGRGRGRRPWGQRGGFQPNRPPFQPRGGPPFPPRGPPNQGWGDRGGFGGGGRFQQPFRGGRGFDRGGGFQQRGRGFDNGGRGPGRGFQDRGRGFDKAGRGGDRGGGRGGRGSGRGGVFNPREYWDARVLENPWRRLEADLGCRMESAAESKNPDEINLDMEEEETEETIQEPLQSTDPPVETGEEKTPLQDPASSTAPPDQPH